MDIIQKLGHPEPLGTFPTENGVNFSLFSQNGSHIFLCIYTQEEGKLLGKFSLKQTKNLWHIELLNLPKSFAYTYIAHRSHDLKNGHIFNPKIELTDPYAKDLDTPSTWGLRKDGVRSIYRKESRFDWENVVSPSIAKEDLILYEMHVRSFTKHPSSGVKNRGTFLGIIEKIPHLKRLGINAVELMPIHEFNETENQRLNPKTGEKLCNYWGYGTVNFFTPMRRYGTAEDLKRLVRELHREGIEVILDVVYNHTTNLNDQKSGCPFFGLDNAVYYIFDENGYQNYTGCGHTLRCQHPILQDLILCSLRYWVTEFHIDGFRFDLASTLTRSEWGIPLKDPPLIKRIESDPILKGAKLIAEPWDPGGLYQLGHFPGKTFLEWNGKFRDDVRRFIRGDKNSQAMKDCLMGSPDLYKSPSHSINFITAHDGFTLCDLVSYNKKYNQENGEGNRDGSPDNISWNCNIEGSTKDKKTLKLRNKQMRNFLFALFLSKGIPMLLMGDEYGHTRRGNNNAYCQDNELNYFLWNKCPFLLPFIRKLIEIRKKYPIFRRKEEIENVQWEEKGYLGLTLNSELFAAFNPSENVYLLKREGWSLLISTDEDSHSPHKLHPYESVLLGKK